jgi:hypothetical protein
MNDVWYADAIIFGEKTCTSCGKVFPACTSYFTKDNREADGLTHQCRACRQNDNAMAKDRARKKRYREGARA